MATSIPSNPQYAKLCSRCAVFQLADASLEDISANVEKETDLDGEVERAPDNLYEIFNGSDCDCCRFLGRILFWWDIEDKPPTLGEASSVRLSLHHVFGPDKAHGYGLRALRIKIRHGTEKTARKTFILTVLSRQSTMMILRSLVGFNRLYLTSVKRLYAG
ncbi:hypothetical protein CEP53_003389 [Fusarium sp. AF-6]|nr:hypothetical protein CEP53_003389 [Fusarium sp. AF-6]